MLLSLFGPGNRYKFKIEVPRQVYVTTYNNQIRGDAVYTLMICKCANMCESVYMAQNTFKDEIYTFDRFYAISRRSEPVIK